MKQYKRTFSASCQPTPMCITLQRRPLPNARVAVGDRRTDNVVNESHLYTGWGMGVMISVLILPTRPHWWRLDA